ncbi:PAQR family membrane homeostasis protein TrhA [Pararhizobium mangrovi]|uniref:Hemolysin III family protein n=1 Tax=Pararhizobium mangrovi TaxID=2590452 RepID=A0A506TZG8_9HYPH|nr:hemolysin III family protein [Pararhizobium mangrovi]TPW26696.1 hemolysin III family protein [Pararhizobium mangrovi]
MSKPALRSYDRRPYDRHEVYADGAVHVAGIALALCGSVALVIASSRLPPPHALVGTIVYALSLLGTLSLSALYNLWPETPVRRWLRRFDHAGIFLLIAGTYTPFVLHMGLGAKGFLVGMWCVAALGMVMKIALTGRFDRLAIFFYLALGWSGAALFGLMIETLRPATLILVLAGGLAYSAGLIFHLWRGLRFQNAIWHTFVLSGAACHYAAVWLTVGTLAPTAL